MTGDLGKDPKPWSEDGHLTTKPHRDAIKKRMVDPDDPLKLVIVVDMWLIRVAFRQLGAESDAPPVTPPWFVPGAEAVWQRIVETERALRGMNRLLNALPGPARSRLLRAFQIAAMGTISGDSRTGCKRSRQTAFRASS